MEISIQPHGRRWELGHTSLMPCSLHIQWKQIQWGWIGHHHLCEATILLLHIQAETFSQQTQYYQKGGEYSWSPAKFLNSQCSRKLRAESTGIHDAPAKWCSQCFNMSPQRKKNKREGEEKAKKLFLLNSISKEHLLCYMGSEDLMGFTRSEHLFFLHFPLIILTGRNGICMAITAKIISSFRLEFLMHADWV